jgi:adenylate kinase
MRLLIMGPPGAGKGTQAALLAGRHDVPAISTGDIFRSEVAAGTELGVLAHSYMAAGEYVPDHVTDAMVRDRLARPDCARGFVLDGYPRTLAQVEELDRVLEAGGAALDRVVVLAVDPEVLVERLLRRAELEGRADDTADVIRRRQELYRQQTAPLIEGYAARGLVREVDGLGAVEEVAVRIDAQLAADPRQPDASPAG